MADTIRIPATTRSDFGKGYARRIRNNDQIPAVVYGHGAEPQHVIIPGHETMLAVRHSNAVLELDVEGSTQLVMVKDIQRHATRPEILHIDLLAVRRGERVEVEIPVHVIGEVDPTAVHNVEENTLTVEADALNVPDSVTINLDGHGVGDHVYAADVRLPEGVAMVSDPELLVINVSEPQAQDLGDTEGETEAPEGDVVAENEA
ncbi:50S ribosomal protein L25/general stress protein Ctc [Kocuria rosea]|jgi:large subunit ribosomal protein L25|uniref:50S ribosomal protein L25/general stress protein Ctc n=1 Tax=Kocuria rosea TaxID=1275 RepID=UPI002541686A|nr:50S ribosomal protein L25/general stress protein Ctc [Kocuria rosea]WIG16347.1 50S ribosomal protein L25/general stress protein Ctc [Kocuria rosea]